MPQSSLTAWLNQPKAVKQSPDVPKERLVSPIPQQQVPTPPQEDNPPPLEVEKATNLPASLPAPSRHLPPNVELRSCTKEDIPHLKRLTSLLLPIPYPEKFYKEIVNDEVTSDLTILAVWHDDPSRRGAEKGRLVGAIRCRLLNHAGSLTTSSGSSPMLYLSTLALLSPFRAHGIATHLLHAVTRRAIDNHGVSSVGAHVWEANAEGLKWYTKRGFKEVSREPGYYRRLNPQGAVVMHRDVRVSDYINGLS